MTRLLILVLMLLAVRPCGAVAGQDARTPGAAPRLGRPGFLILASARDSTVGYARRPGPGPGQYSVIWGGGQLVLPDSMTLEPFGQSDLGLPTREDLRGSGADGALTFRDGRFTVDQPLLLTDGVISLYVADGELEIRGPQIRYYPPTAPATGKKVADPRAGFLFLSGMVVLILVLLRMARLRSRGRVS